jgi:hypothetical protein
MAGPRVARCRRRHDDGDLGDEDPPAVPGPGRRRTQTLRPHLLPLRSPRPAVLHPIRHPADVEDLGTRMQVHATSTTNSVDRLEKAGLVARRSHPDDRRTTLVDLTEAGRETRRPGDRRPSTPKSSPPPTSPGSTSTHSSPISKSLRSGLEEPTADRRSGLDLSRSDLHPATARSPASEPQLPRVHLGDQLVGCPSNLRRIVVPITTFAVQTTGGIMSRSTAAALPFGLTDEQQTVSGMVREFADTEIAPHALEWDAEHFFPVDVIRKSADLGMGGIYVSEEAGGTGMGRMDAALIFEAMSTGCPSVAAYISIHNMVAWMIDKFGNDEQKAKYLTPLVSMEHLGSYCLTEPNAGSDAAALRTSAREDGDSLRPQRCQAVHLRRRHLGNLPRHGPQRSGRGSWNLRLHPREGHGGTELRPQRAEDGLARAADPSGDHGERPSAEGEHARRTRVRASRSLCPASTADA